MLRIRPESRRVSESSELGNLLICRVDVLTRHQTQRQADLHDGPIAALLADLKQRGIGVLITDHNVRETLDICDKGCIIYGGQVLFSGSPEALVADENVRRLYLGEGFTL